MTFPAITMPAEEVFAVEAREKLLALIAQNHGQEVFVLGTCTEEGKVVEVDAMAYGNAESVPAPARGARPGQVTIHNHPSGTIEPSEADINIASELGAAGIGFLIVDNAVTRVRVVVEPYFPPPVLPIDIEALAAEFGPEGSLARSFRDYEHRPQQTEMVREIARAFNEGRIAVVEAGTGVGKSFAYLAPAIVWAQQNQTRIVISTNTTNLQEQLLRKDIPELQKLLGTNVRVALVKGRNRYLSRRRLAFARAHPELLDTTKYEELERLAEWAETTTDGTRDDLSLTVAEETWDAVQSDQHDCLRALCPHFSRCFFYKSRQAAASAQIIVANHHLVLADLALRMQAGGEVGVGILPPYDYLILDEAHTLDEVATDYFATSISALGIRRQLGRLHSTKGERKGALASLQSEVLRLDPKERYEPTATLHALFGKELDRAYITLVNSLDIRWPEIEKLFKELSERGPRTAGSETQIRIPPQSAPPDEWKDKWAQLCEHIEVIRDNTRALAKVVKNIVGAMDEYPEKIRKELLDLRTRIHGTYQKLQDYAHGMELFATAEDERYCRWLGASTSDKRSHVSLCVAPVDMSPALRQGLFEAKRAVILTSATLTSAGSFDFFARYIGLPSPKMSLMRASEARAEAQPATPLDTRVDYVILDSPFDYANVCLLGVPSDLPDPNNSEFLNEALPVVARSLQITKGHAFVLFTSYKDLGSAHKALAPQLRDEGMTVLKQGDGSNHKLIQTFLRARNPVLFATASFWQGVDVRGDKLQNLIIVRLPFQPPTSPILEARCELMTKEGKDPFQHLSVPYAIIRFKQGFGRLIRSKTDRGIVLVLDSRLVTRSYGKAFLRSLPPVRIVTGKSEEVLSAFNSFVRRW